MLIRLSRQGHFEFIDDVLLHYRRHDRNLGAAVTIPQQAWFVRCKAFHSPENSTEQQHAARMGWRAYQVLRAGEVWREVRAAARTRDVHAAARSLLRIGVFAGRYLRGFPLATCALGAGPVVRRPSATCP